MLTAAMTCARRTLARMPSAVEHQACALLRRSAGSLCRGDRVIDLRLRSGSQSLAVSRRNCIKPFALLPQCALTTGT